MSDDIATCRFCGVRQAFSSPRCAGCGAPLEPPAGDRLTDARLLSLTEALNRRLRADAGAAGTDRFGRALGGVVAGVAGAALIAALWTSGNRGDVDASDARAAALERKADVLQQMLDAEHGG